jgi:hypothetical protein
MQLLLVRHSSGVYDRQSQARQKTINLANKELKMKRVLLSLVAAVVLLTFSAYAQSASQGSTDQSAGKPTDQSAGKTKAAKVPLKTIAGTISDDGKTFTADKDKKEWTIKNPEDVKGHEGHHVKLQAHVYADTNEVHVMKVTMMAAKAKKKGAS